MQVACSVLKLKIKKYVSVSEWSLTVVPGWFSKPIRTLYWKTALLAALIKRTFYVANSLLVRDVTAFMLPMATNVSVNDGKWNCDRRSPPRDPRHFHSSGYYAHVQKSSLIWSIIRLIFELSVANSKSNENM